MLYNFTSFLAKFPFFVMSEAMKNLNTSEIWLQRFGCASEASEYLNFTEYPG